MIFFDRAHSLKVREEGSKSCCDGFDSEFDEFIFGGG